MRQPLLVVLLLALRAAHGGAFTGSAGAGSLAGSARSRHNAAFRGSTSLRTVPSLAWPRLSRRESRACAPSPRQASELLEKLRLRSPPTKLRSAADGAAATGPAPTRLDSFRKYAQYFCNCFPIWTLLTALVALKAPRVFLGVPPSTFPAQIGLLMLCMGITLKPSDFARVAQRPGAVLLAFAGCYGVMPGLAVLLGKLLRLEPGLAAGLVLVACINGAQASNLCTYIGQGDLALSVLMTTMTTIGAMVMTPLVGQLLLGQVVPVNGAAMARSTVEVVLAPILLGMAVNRRFPRAVRAVLPFTPVLGVAITCLLVGTSVAGCAGAILGAGARLQLAAALLHALGGVAGYAFTKPFYGEDVCRTFAIEFAMKSSAFGYLLASLHFADFAVRVPSAVSIVWMTLIGSSLAVASRFFPPAECRVPEDAEA